MAEAHNVAAHSVAPDVAEAPAPWTLALVEAPAKPIFDDAGKVVPELRDRAVAGYCDSIARATGEHGASLVAFPQFGLTGYMPLNNPGWIDAAFYLDGPELDAIRDAARKAGAYAVVQGAERHDAFPGRYFFSAVLIGPGGDIVMVHRKNYALSFRTSPIDVYDRFVETFGRDAFQPVAQTPLGGIGIAIAAEVHWPEAVRGLALKGAEVCINPIAAPVNIDYLDRPAAPFVRSVRAFENVMYLGTANIAGEEGGPGQYAYDFRGASIGRQAGEFMLAEIDIAALRAQRRLVAGNFLAELQPSIHRDLSDFDLWPRNVFPEGPARSFDELAAVQDASWERLRASWRKDDV